MKKYPKYKDSGVEWINIGLQLCAVGAKYGCEENAGIVVCAAGATYGCEEGAEIVVCAVGATYG